MCCAASSWRGTIIPTFFDAPNVVFCPVAIPTPTWKNWACFLQKRGEVAVTQTVALHGLGGVGKTQLAIEYAWRHLGGYEAVLWVRADSPATLDASLAGIAGVLGLPEVSAKEQGVQTEAVLGWLKGRERWLLIADNADTDEAAVTLH
jgi:hypothetical protein